MTKNAKIAVPWALIDKDQSKYIKGKYIPKGVHLREPSKMHADEIHTLCNAWVRRQHYGDKVFRFRRVVSSHTRKGVGRWEGRVGDTSSDGSDDGPLDLPPKIDVPRKPVDKGKGK